MRPFNRVLRIENSQSGSPISQPIGALISKNSNNSQSTSWMTNNIQKPSYDILKSDSQDIRKTDSKILSLVIFEL